MQHWRKKVEKIHWLSYLVFSNYTTVCLVASFINIVNDETDKTGKVKFELKTGFEKIYNFDL